MEKERKRKRNISSRRTGINLVRESLNCNGVKHPNPRIVNI